MTIILGNLINKLSTLFRKSQDFLYLSKITKNDSKILLSFTKDAKETKLHVYKMYVRLWDFGTLKSHCNFLALMVWESYSHVHDANEMVA